MPKKSYKVSTFSREMTPEEAEEEKRKDTCLGKSLREADRVYEEKRRGE